MKHRKRIEAHVKGFEQMPKRTQKAIVEMIKAAHRYVGKQTRRNTNDTKGCNELPFLSET